MAGGFVTEGHLSQVSADHVEFDFDVVKGLAAVDGDVVAYHFGHDDGISEVSFDGSRLLSGLSVLFGLLAFGVETDVFMFDF